MEAFGVLREHVSLVCNSMFCRMLRGRICEKETECFGKEKERKENGNWRTETGNRKPESFPGWAGATAVTARVVFRQKLQREGLHFSLQSFPVST
jgi:hypothetical protein